jgi:hypothetical protein
MHKHSKWLKFVALSVGLAAVTGGTLNAANAQGEMPLHVAIVEVDSLCVWTRARHGTFHCREFIAAYVQIVDQQGQPVGGAQVTGTFTGCDKNDTASARTNDGGFAIVKGRRLECGCVHTFTVTRVTKNGGEWRPTNPLPSNSRCICGCN